MCGLGFGGFLCFGGFFGAGQGLHGGNVVQPAFGLAHHGFELFDLVILQYCLVIHSLALEHLQTSLQFPLGLPLMFFNNRSLTQHDWFPFN